MLPSKELLSAVLSYPVVEVKEINFNCVYYGVDSSYSRMYGEEIRDINMYELIHHMKEWIRSEGYEIQIKMIERDGNVFIEFIDWRNGDSVFGEDVFKGRTEWDAMVIFAELVLEQQNDSD